MTEKEIRIAAIRDAKRDEKKDRLAQSADDKYNAEIGRMQDLKFYHVSIGNDLGDIASWYGYCLSAREARKSALGSIAVRLPYWCKLRVLKSNIHKFEPRKVVPQ